MDATSKSSAKHKEPSDEEPLLQSSITERDPAPTETHEDNMIRGNEDESIASKSSSQELEMDDINSDNGEDIDEETGLTSKERNKYHDRNTARNQLDVRIAGNHSLTQEEKRDADKNVIKQLLANAVLIALWYTFSIAISIYNKEMFSQDKSIKFPYPMFATSLHMAVQFCLASTILYFVPRLRPKSPTVSYTPLTPPTEPPPPLMTPFFYITRLIPCGSATSLDIGFGNMSLKFITLTFYTMTKSSALGFVLLFAFLFRLETPSLKLILIIATMTAGVVMMVAGEAAFHLLGFILILLSSCLSGFRWALTQILLLRHPATSNPFSTLWFLTPIMFATLFLFAMFVEGPLAIVHGLSKLTTEKGTALGLLILLTPGVIAFCMIASEFALLRRTNVVTLSICGIFKEVMTITAAELKYQDPLTPINISGLCVTLASIAAYNYLKITRMRREAREGVKAKDVVVDADTARAGDGAEEAILRDGREDEEEEEEERRPRRRSRDISPG
ncbi:MAG: hypothetical protein Q9227_002351 [Pyrenula ochraceoflavens]